MAEETISLMARSGDRLARLSLRSDGSVSVSLDGATVQPAALSLPLELGADAVAILNLYVGLVRAGFPLRLPEALGRDLAASSETLRRGLEGGVSLAGARAGERRTERKTESGRINAGKATLARQTQDGSPVVAAIVELLTAAGRPLDTLSVVEALQARNADLPATTVRSTLHRISRAKTPKIRRTLDGWIPA